MDRAKRPLPPTNLKVNGLDFPSSVSNAGGVALTWNRRKRITTTVRTPNAGDEVPETGTEYWVRHGPIGAQTDTLLGTSTSGTFTLGYSGKNTFYVFSKLDGLESTPIPVTVTATSGASGTIAGGAIAGLTASPPAATNKVLVYGSIAGFTGHF